MANLDLPANAFAKPPALTAEQRQANRRARKEERRRAIYGHVVPSENASNSPDLHFAKGDRDQDKADAHKAEVRQIRKTRRKLFAIESHCMLRGDSQEESDAKYAISRHEMHEMHEDPSRAQTRGLPPEQRFNLFICGRVCPGCHQLATDNVIRPSFHNPELGWRGDYDVLVIASGHILRHMRRGLDSRLHASRAQASPERAERGPSGDIA